MGTIYYFFTGKEQDADTREWYTYENEYWHVFCDKCESFNVVPTGYRMMGTRELTTNKKTLFHGIKTVTETYEIYTREFTCKECGGVIVIQPDEITGNNRLSEHQVPHLKAKIYELESRAQLELKNIPWDRKENYAIYAGRSRAEANKRAGVPRKFNSYELIDDSFIKYKQSRLDEWIKQQERY